MNYALWMSLVFFPVVVFCVKRETGNLAART